MIKLKYITLLFSLMFLMKQSFSQNAKTIKRLYIGNDDHTDYMWTGDEVAYDSAFVKMLDYYLIKVDSTKNDIDNFQSRFNTDGNYWLRVYQKYRSPSQFDKLIAAIKSGHISSPLNSVVSTFGGQSTESAIRGMYYAGRLERNFNIKFTLASSMENNTLPLGLSSIWAGSGAKYSWKGIGGYGSQLSYESRANRNHQLYNYTGIDSSSLLMKWYQYNEKTTGSFGGYAECRITMNSKNATKEIGTVINMLDLLCDTISPSSKYPYNIAAAFGYGHDDLTTYEADSFIEAAKNGTNQNRSVRVSNEEDFFIDVERSYPVLPSEAVSFGNEWDLLVASMNETTAKVKRSVEKLRSAEALAAIVSLKDPDFYISLKTARNLAWDGLGLYWEHNWTGDGPVKNSVRGAWQIKLQHQITSYVDSLYNLSLTKLGTQLSKSKQNSFFVFNPLSWERNDFADLQYNGDSNIQVKDLITNQTVKHQLITRNNIQYLRIEATKIPSVGYKTFEINPKSTKKINSSIVVKDQTISNEFYTVELSKSGVITKIIDRKNNNKNLVKEINGKLLNDLGSTDINDGEPIVIENSGPVSVTLKAVSKNPIAHSVRITLFANSPKIFIDNSIDENFKDVKTWAFSFNVEDATTNHEELGAILNVNTVNNGGNYANQNARYDWQSFNHFLNVGNKNSGITLSNLDCSFFKLGQSSVSSLDHPSSQISALAGGQIDKKVEDGGVLGIHNQLRNKHFSYSFALTSQNKSFNAVDDMKFALEHQTPLVAGLITGNQKKEASKSSSLISLSNPNVLLWSIKPSEEGIKDGLITRFWNLSNAKIAIDFSINNQFKEVWQTSHIETNIKKIETKELNKLEMFFNPQQIKTYRINLKD